MTLDLHHYLSQLHAGTEKDAKEALRIEECIEAAREEFQAATLHKINDAPFAEVFFGIYQDNMQENIEKLLSAIYDLPEIERPAFLEIHEKFKELNLHLLTMQAAADAALKKLNEELS